MSYIHTVPTLSDVLAGRSGLEDMFLQENPLAHVVSQLYSLLRNALSLGLPPYTKIWEAELRHSISLADWQKCFVLTQTFPCHYNSRKGV